MKNKKIVLAHRPEGMVKNADFSIMEDTVPGIQEGELLIENMYISIDPAIRGWMNHGKTYIKGVEIGETMRAFAAGMVIESRHSGYKPGDYVQGMTGAQKYAVSNGNFLIKCNTAVAPLSWHLGILGMPGMTAYFGMMEKAKVKKGDTVLISGAAGTVGSLAGQIAKNEGCRVIGIAGGSEKCAFLKSIGFEEAIDYKNESVTEALSGICPSGIDVFFDNVGGKILDEALLHLARNARVIICGAISQYNSSQTEGIRNYLKIVTARATLCGLIVFDYFDRYNEALDYFYSMIQNKKIVYREQILEGIECFPAALAMLFKGENKGKLILKI
ncbi:MAG: NADP-dependent oxidoreductase [Chitinophagaceae bacterium]|nr:NADP-dependent oxidoreductase [Chitinophagaceae bacterium]